MEQGESTIEYEGVYFCCEECVIEYMGIGWSEITPKIIKENGIKPARERMRDG